MTTVDHAMELVSRRDFHKLEDLWTDMITDTSIGTNQYISIAEAVRKTGDPGRADLLLEILSEYYETQEQYDRMIEIQKHMLRFNRENPQIRKKIIEIYRTKHKTSLHIEDYLECSGLTKDEPIMKALQKFEEYLQYDIGKHFFFERYGMGEVVAVIPAKKEIVVDFEKKKKHFLTIDIAKGLLTPITQSHFLLSKRENIQELKSMAREQPAEVVLMMLRSFREPMTASTIKGYLDGIVEKSQLNKFWERTRKILEKHDNIRVAGKTSKTYSYVASVTDKEQQVMESFQKAKLHDKYRHAEECARKMPTLFKTLVPQLTQIGKQCQKDHPGIALEILLMFTDHNVDADLGYSIDDLLHAHEPADILEETTNPQYRARFIAYQKAKDHDKWPETGANILFAANDFTVMDVVFDHMNDSPAKMEDFYHRILAMPKEYPKQFHWMLKKIESGIMNEYLRPNLIPRFIDSLNYVKGIKATMKKILTLNNFDSVVARANETEAQRIRDSLKSSPMFSEHEKSGYMRILEHYFPAMVEEQTDIIYSTEAALNRKKKELKHILTIEIPANKKEIGRAREFGDLSENFEYKAAKEKQDQLYAKVKTIESELQRVRVIDPAKSTTDSVSVGTVVTLQNTGDDSVVAYTIMGRWDTDLPKKILSNEAPLAQSMLGRKINDTVSIEGTEYRITEISKATQ
ncbi:MAG: GreA/GreB family elongation factor [candidate division WOR-3 bacterium]|nr:MAG: GreA/GreB family elongation factor [candidate division WOR-3 bacterium]